MIIDHDESKRTGRVMTLAAMGQFSQAVDEVAGPTDETMPLRVVQELKESGEIHPQSSVTGRVPRKMNGQFAGPFPVRRVLPSLRKFAEEAPIEQVVEVVKALSDKPEGVERSGDDTATHALPAVEKMTGKPSLHAIAHRTARQIQEQYPHLMIWYGEYTKSFWVMDSYGLREFKTITAMCQGMGW